MPTRREFDVESWFVLVTVVVCWLVIVAAVGWFGFLVVKTWGWV